MNMTRKKAFLSHFLFSAVIVALVLTFVLLVWYPQPYFQIIGAIDVIRILIVVDLILGPLLTLILFKPGKKGLKFDMTMVAVLQLSALVYGVHTLYIERPYYVIFVGDRFQVLAERDIDKETIDNEVFLAKPWDQPIYVIAKMPEDPKERSRITEEIFFEGKRDVHQRPELWVAYDESTDAVRQRTRPLAELLERRPDIGDEIHDLLGGRAERAELVYVPVMGRKHILTMVLDAGTLAPVDVINIDPWETVE
jgi:hypothetical protein